MSLVMELKSALERGKNEPDTLLAWYNMVLIFLIMVMAQGHLVSLGSFYVCLRLTYDVTREEVAEVLNYLFIANCFTGALAGPIGHKIGPRWAMIFGLLLSSSSMLVCFFHPSSCGLWWLKICFVVHGGGIGLLAPNLFQQIVLDFQRHRGKAIMIFMLTMGFNGLIYPWTINYLIDFYGLRGAFLFLGAFSVQSILLVVLVRFNNSRKANDISRAAGEDSKQDSNAENKKENSVLMKKVLALLKSYKFYNLLFSQSVAISSYYTIITTVVDLGLDASFNITTASALVVLHCVGDALARIVTGWFIDNHLVSNQFITGFGLILTASAYLMIPIVRGVTLIVVVFVAGVCFGLSSTSRLTLLSLFGVEVSSVAYGFNVFASGCLFAGVPSLIGLFRDKLGSYLYLYVLLSCCSFASGVLYFVEHYLTRIERK